MKKIKVLPEELYLCTLFKNLPKATIKKIATFPEAKIIEKGTVIIKEGDKGDSMFIILQGEVDVLKTEKKIKVATLKAGTFVGEGALVSGAPRNATVVTATDTKVAFFDLEAFNKLIVTDASIPVTLMKTHTERCKSVVKTGGNVFAKSKKIIAVFSLLGLILFLKYGGVYFNIDFVAKIGEKIPNEIMAMFGPVTGAIMLKFQKMFIGDIVDKIEKL